jgi:hypothetical protein
MWAPNPEIAHQRALLSQVFRHESDELFCAYSPAQTRAKFEGIDNRLYSQVLGDRLMDVSVEIDGAAHIGAPLDFHFGKTGLGDEIASLEVVTQNLSREEMTKLARVCRGWLLERGSERSLSAMLSELI